MVSDLYQSKDCNLQKKSNFIKYNNFICKVTLSNYLSAKLYRIAFSSCSNEIKFTKDFSLTKKRVIILFE